MTTEEKRGVGRPFVDGTAPTETPVYKTIKVQFNVLDRHKDWMRDQAVKQGITMSAFLRLILDELMSQAK